MTVRPGPAVRGALSYRPVRPDELDACADVWRVSINDYIGRLNQPDMQAESAPLVRLYAHLQSTDPERFVVATRPDPDAPGGERIVAFAAAVVGRVLGDDESVGIVRLEVGVQPQDRPEVIGDVGLV